jgi:hypothetical protein
METKTLTLEQVEKVLRNCRLHPSLMRVGRETALPAHRFSEQTVRDIVDDMEREAR